MNMQAAIPVSAGCVDGWEKVDMTKSRERLVAIGPGTKYNVMTSAVYAGEHLHSPYRGDQSIGEASTVIYVRRSVAERLVLAQDLLPGDMSLVVFDGYRSAQVQQALFDQFMSELTRQHPGWTDNQLRRETEKYVAVPSDNPTRPSPHSTGGAVDVAILDGDRMIEFGAAFDHGSERSALRYFEDNDHVLTDHDWSARSNRRLLYAVMSAVGFGAYKHEWWHFNAPETQMGARDLGIKSASFGIATPPNLARPKTGQVNSRMVANIERIAPK